MRRLPVLVLGLAGLVLVGCDRNTSLVKEAVLPDYPATTLGDMFDT